MGRLSKKKMAARAASLASVRSRSNSIIAHVDESIKLDGQATIEGGSELSTILSESAVSEVGT